MTTPLIDVDTPRKYRVRTWTGSAFGFPYLKVMVVKVRAKDAESAEKKALKLTGRVSAEVIGVEDDN